MTFLSPGLKALLATVFFALAGTIGLLGIENWALQWPTVFIYCMLLIHTFPSIRIFTQITPTRDAVQGALDLVLAAFYLMAAASFADGYRFLLAMTIVFIVATVKYILLLRQRVETDLLWRKIYVDAFGAVSSFAALVVAEYGREAFALRAGALVFFSITIYLFLIKPLYRLSNDPERTR